MHTYLYVFTHTHLHTPHEFMLTIVVDGTASDIAGEVVGVGPGVEAFKIGDKVVSMLSTMVSALIRLSICYLSKETMPHEFP